MKREIKFRCWDVQAENMFIPKQIPNNLIGTIPEDDDEQFFIHMQYTGLKDKNGIEIYEGDMVKIFTDDEKENFELWEIAFQEASFKIKKNHFDEQTTIASVFFMPLESDESFYSHELYEVIGNIYSNPELLNQK